MVGRRSIGDAECIMQAGQIILCRNKADADLTSMALWRKWWYGQAKRVAKARLRIILDQTMDAVWVEVVPALDGARRSWFCSDCGLRFGSQLQERLFVAMVWLVLRHEHNVGLLDL